MSEFVEFTISSRKRFSALQRVIAELKHDKDADDWRSNDELLKFFDAESRSHFYWPLDDVRRRRVEDLLTRVVLETPTEQATGLTWDFDSLMDAFVNGEYNLLRCETIHDGKARLNFYSLAYPYGGVGCMVALIEAFGGVVTGIDDGTGFVSFPRT
jgi:hypothetical protein